ncbi:hybrid sensor histidine kinase/response regulator [Sorangium sp. So ce1153]|uniref:hybrid sensor histidine kinase/response regulator n=1 Tax=Sorangium sp. So ce1153 TaxID=3133333 RepID=UPI003F62FAB0
MNGRSPPPRRRLRVTLALALAVALAPAPAAGDTPAPPTGDLRARGAPWMRVFNAEDGIPQITINAVAFEPGGRLWIGTQNGAASYDGRRFTPLPLPTGGGSSWVQSIAVGQDGAVWFGMMTGQVIRHAGGRSTRFGAAEGLTGEKPIRTLLEAPTARGRAVFAATTDGLYRLDGERWARVDLGPGFEHPDVRALHATTLLGGEPALWAGTGDGLFRCDARGCARFATTADGLPSNVVMSLLETSGETGGRVLWAGTRGGIARLAEARWESFTPATVPALAHPVRALAETVSGTGARTLWAGTYGGGLARLQGRTWTALTMASSTLPDDHVMALAAAAGAHGGRTLWIGTNAGGLARLRHDGWAGFTQRNAGLAGSLTSIAEVRAPGGQASPPELWVAMNNTVARSAGQGFAPLDAPEIAGKLGDLVTFMLPSAREPGVVWIGSDTTGLHRWTRGQLTTYTPQSSPLPHVGVRWLSESLDGRALWVGTVGGAARLEADGAWQVFTRAQVPLADDHVTSIVETRGAGGKVSTWFGTMKGLSRLEGGQWRSFTAASAPLASDAIAALAELRDARGARVLWIGAQGGISRYNLDADAWIEPLNERSRPALPDSIVYGVRADAQGRVYAFTDRGVTRFTPRSPTPDDPAELAAYTFTTDDGLPSNECNQNGSFVDSAGRVWASTAGGVAVFDPAEEVPDAAPRPLALAARAQRARGALALAPGASLAWDENTVSFEYTLLSLFHERSTRYRTQLANFDAAPSAWSADVSARYTNLAPGPYTFQVWGRDHAGNVAGPATVAFRVRPAPWRTAWAYLGYAAALGGLVYGGVRLRLRALRRRTRELELLVEQRTAELTAARDAADAANQAKTTFLASMSHELRTPLNGILGYAQLLQRSPRLAPEDRPSVDVVRRSGEHLLTLIDDVLDLARVEAGRMDLAPGDVHLPSLARTVAELCKVRAAQKGLAFEHEVAEGTPAWVRADEKRLTQVLLNLLGNAIKFTRAGRVTFRVAGGEREGRGGVVFRVEDTGPGIAPADLARIFEPFEQAGDERARVEGAGLGLAITRRIVDQMGGRIDVESAPGEGSTFTVALDLPALAGASPAPSGARRGTAAITGYEGARRTILVVDDHEDNRAFLRDALAPLGFEVEEAEGGEAAVALADACRPDLALMDLRMPDLGGDEAARRIRRIPGLAGLPILATSASVEEPERARSAAAGCDGFLPKPIDLGALLALLERRLALTWVRAAPASARGAGAGAEGNGGEAPPRGPAVPPPPEELARLAELVERGRIQDVVQRLAALEAEDPRLAPWLREVRGLAEEFRIRELGERLAAPERGAAAS